IDRSVIFWPSPSSSRSSISASVRSGSFATRSLSQPPCGSSGELLPPRGRALTLPVCASSVVQRIAEAGLTLKRAAACRRELPAATSATTRDRRSSECAAPMSASPNQEASWTHMPPPCGIPAAITIDSTRWPNALDGREHRGGGTAAFGRLELHFDLHADLQGLGGDVDEVGE